MAIHHCLCIALLWSKILLLCCYRSYRNSIYRSLPEHIIPFQRNPQGPAWPDMAHQFYSPNPTTIETTYYDPLELLDQDSADIKATRQSQCHHLQAGHPLTDALSLSGWSPELLSSSPPMQRRTGGSSIIPPPSLLLSPSPSPERQPPPTPHPSRLTSPTLSSVPPLPLPDDLTPHIHHPPLSANPRASVTFGVYSLMNFFRTSSTDRYEKNLIMESFSNDERLSLPPGFPYMDWKGIWLFVGEYTRGLESLVGEWMEGRGRWGEVRKTT